MGFLQVSAIGNLGRDPEMNYTPQGTAVTKFSIAINQKRGDKESTTWVNCTAWNKLAEVLNEHLHKGDQVFVQGSLDVRQYTTKDGKSGVSTDLTVQNFSFLGTKKASGTSGNEDDPLGDLGDHPF